MAIGYITFTMVCFSTLIIVGTTYGMIIRQAAVQRGALSPVAVRGESEWALGQIIAPFSWSPLIIDLVAGAIGTTPLSDQGCISDCDICERERRVAVYEGQHNNGIQMS